MDLDMLDIMKLEVISIAFVLAVCPPGKGKALPHYSLVGVEVQVPYLSLLTLQ